MSLLGFRRFMLGIVRHRFSERVPKIFRKFRPVLLAQNVVMPDDRDDPSVAAIAADLAAIGRQGGLARANLFALRALLGLPVVTADATSDDPHDQVAAARRLLRQAIDSVQIDDKDRDVGRALLATDAEHEGRTLSERYSGLGLNKDYYYLRRQHVIDAIAMWLVDQSAVIARSAPDPAQIRRDRRLASARARREDALRSQTLEKDRLLNTAAHTELVSLQRAISREGDDAAGWALYQFALLMDLLAATQERSPSPLMADVAQRVLACSPLTDQDVSTLREYLFAELEVDKTIWSQFFDHLRNTTQGIELADRWTQWFVAVDGNNVNRMRDMLLELLPHAESTS